MEIVNGAAFGKLEERMAGLGDGELLAQELVQKGAIHALEFLAREPTPERIRAMLESCRAAAEVISAECRRRGLGTVIDPAAH